MTKEVLKQYRSIVAELNEVNDRINSNTVHGTVTGSDSEFPYVNDWSGKKTRLNCLLPVY